VRVVTVTVAHGRHDHLRLPQRGLDAGDILPDARVVVAIDDPGLAAVAVESPTPVRVCPLDPVGAPIPLARARNLGARTAIADGADLIVFLDVDCIPDRAMVARYVAAARQLPDALLSGPVAYLEPPPPQGYDLAALPGAPGHPGRPVPPEDALVPGADPTLFWSLSFAVTVSTWRRLGGFCERYSGYGAEDTDLGQIAADRGVDHVWVGGAWAYHQFHPVHDPPVDRVADIVRNATVFHERWGWWPMTGWLDAFADLGLAVRDEDGWSCAQAVTAAC
jgi:N-acetylglucosaminyl-diphospho-decaprenol L-rhamnosyltransferase